jgi:SagB-type dehydrogenase family enzyme
MGLVELPSVQNAPEAITFAEAVFQRRSRRNFVRKPVPVATFSWLMGLLNFGDSCGEIAPSKGCMSVGVLIGDVETIDPGFYLFEAGNHALSLIRPGLLTEEMAHICLDQEWLGRCSLHFVFLSNLEATENKWGSRGYRYAMLEAGRLGQRLYLAAESIKYGCCGIGAFYDKEAKTLLSLRSGSSMLYLVALGPLKKAFV